MKLTQKMLIVKYLQSLNGAWVREGMIRSLKTPWGFIGFRGDRDTREMIETPELRQKWGLEAGFEGKFRVVRAKGLGNEHYLTIQNELNPEYVKHMEQVFRTTMNFPPAFEKKVEVNQGRLFK